MEVLYFISLLLKIINVCVIIFLSWITINTLIFVYKTEYEEFPWYVYLPCMFIIILLGL